MAANGDPVESDKRQGTRVYKKSSPNGKITTYLGKRDFYDHLSHCDPIDGAVLVDPEYLKDRKVFVHVLAAFRYGREDLDVLGLTFRKDLFLASMQVYPPLEENKKPLTRLQERLVKKLGANAHPFIFQVPKNAPASVTLQPAPGDTGQPCGVDYELKTYVADTVDDKPQKRNSVRLAIRKLTYAPAEPAPQPTAEASKEFMMSHGALRLEATLDKEKYYHGESIAVNVCIDNNSNKTVKKIKITVLQCAEITLFSSQKHSSRVCHTEDNLPIQPSQTGFCKVYQLTPLLSQNRDKQGLALDGKLRHEDTNLASSTIFNAASKPDKENLGIIVQYRVKVRLSMGFAAGDLSVELPFTLTQPEPRQETSAPPQAPRSTEGEPCPAPAVEPVAVDTNLIELDTSTEGYFANQDDDLIFEDFARLRLKGHEGDEADA